MPKSKKRRRANGEGTIYKRPNGTWAGQITINGKRHTVYGRRQKDVVDKIKELQTQVLTGTYVAPKEITVKQLVNTWLDVYTKPHIKQVTYNNYKQVIDKYIIPALGSIRVQELQPVHLQEFYNSLKGKPGVLVGVYTVLGSSLKLAETQHIINTNPDKMTRHIVPNLKKRRTLTQEELDRFLSFAKKEFLYPLILLGIGTGLRRGELIGLKWSDIDFENNTVTVQRELQYTKLDDGNFGFIETPPKSISAYRTIPVPEEIMKVLKNYKKLYDTWLNVINIKTDYVFITTKGTPINPVYITSIISKITKEAGLKGTSLHVLRHTYATRLAELGIHPKVAQALLGHANIQTTMNVYTDISEKLSEDAQSKIQKFLDNRHPSN